MKRRLAVTGCGRCGSSLIMQMLDAGGVRCTDAYPAYEDVRLNHRLQARPALHTDGAVKILTYLFEQDPTFVERSCPTDWIWVHRDFGEMAKSQVKFLVLVTGIPMPADEQVAAAAGFRAQVEAESLRWPPLLSEGPHRRLTVSFENTLADPLGTALAIEQFLGRSLDLVQMARRVRPRAPQCLTGLLEDDLLAAWRRA